MRAGLDAIAIAAQALVGRGVGGSDRRRGAIARRSVRSFVGLVCGLAMGV